MMQSRVAVGLQLNFPAGAPPITPPEVEVNRRRKADVARWLASNIFSMWLGLKDYLHRLGIQKDHEPPAEPGPGQHSSTTESKNRVAPRLVQEVCGLQAARSAHHDR